MRPLGRQELSRALQAATKSLSTQKKLAGPRVFEHLVARIASLAGTLGITALTRSRQELYWTALNLQVAHHRGKDISSRGSIDPMVSKWKKQFGDGKRIPIPETSFEVVVTVEGDRDITVSLAVVSPSGPVPLAEPASVREPPDPLAAEPDTTAIAKAIARHVREKLRDADVGELLGFERMVGQLAAPAVVNIFRGHLATFETGARGRRVRRVAAVVLFSLLGTTAAYGAYELLKRLVLPNLFAPQPSSSRQGTLAPTDRPSRPPDLVWPLEEGRAFPRVLVWNQGGTTREFIYEDGGTIAFRRRWPDSNIEFTWQFYRGDTLVGEVKTWEPRVRYTFPLVADREEWHPIVIWRDAANYALTLERKDGGVVATGHEGTRPLGPPARRIESVDGHTVAEVLPGGDLAIRASIPTSVGRREDRAPIFTGGRASTDRRRVELVFRPGPADPATQLIEVTFGDGAGFTVNAAMRFGAAEWWSSPQTDGEDVLVHLERDSSARDTWDSYVVRAQHRYRRAGTFRVIGRLIEPTPNGETPHRIVRDYSATLVVEDDPAPSTPLPSTGAPKTPSR